MSIPELADFTLVGRTALALRYGHRKSIDLDLFSSTDFDYDTITDALRKHFVSFKHLSTNSIGIFGFIDGVKIDLIKYHFYPIIAPVRLEENIRFMSDQDIMAMKVNAILRRGVKKDFWDIAELLQHYSLDEVINCYSTKYSNQIIPISIPRALTYFEDADKSDEPVDLNNKTWSKIKYEIQKIVREYLI
jgi:hypothetical protein